MASSSHMIKGVQHLKVSLEDIKLATNNFGDKNLIAQGGFGKVYIGKLTLSEQEITVAVKRLDHTGRQGNHEFLMEIQMLSCYKHENLVSLVGFCEEGGENILIYEHVNHGSLDRYLSSTNLSWIQRLKISIGAARGFNYLHDDVGTQHRVLHRDIKSSNILLNEYWEAKVSDFGLSKIGLSNVDFTFLITNACGTYGYVDPQYVKTGILTKESDVYSFGVVLFEILCGRLALINTLESERRFLSSFARRAYDENRLYDIIFPGIKDQVKAGSLNIFSTVAYQCLKETRSERPTMGWVVENLEKALQLQLGVKVAGLIRVGTWGKHGYLRCSSSSKWSRVQVQFQTLVYSRLGVCVCCSNKKGTWGKQSGGPQNNWSFELDYGHKLQKITINHGDVIYSLMFTTESRGSLYTSNEVGGLTNGETLSEVTFDFDEEIVGIYGTIGTRYGDTTISSLSFVTNKRKQHGPFGKVTKSVFFVPFNKGSFAGLYGVAGDYIDSIGVYVKSYQEITKVGTWGTSELGGPQNIWYFKLKRNHHLNKITIDHGDLIYSLIFTTLYEGSTYPSKQAGGWNGGDIVSEVTFDEDEEINAIEGTVAKSRVTLKGYTIISSISFMTNKKTHGPFGKVRGKPFTVGWDDGSFAGFYGLCGYYIDSIGVYLKSKM